MVAGLNAHKHSGSLFYTNDKPHMRVTSAHVTTKMEEGEDNIGGDLLLTTVGQSNWYYFQNDTVFV